MTTLYGRSLSSPHVVANAVGTTHPAPANGNPTPDGYFNTGVYTKVRTYISYGGTVTAARLVLYTYADNIWYRGEEKDLTPADGSESFDWDISPQTQCYFRVMGLTGTAPTVTAKVGGIS